VVVVGAVSDWAHVPPVECGSAYVFRYDSVSGMWAQEQKLLASDGADDDEFGRSVSVSNDVAVVGARVDDDLGSDSGSAYVYRYDSVSGTWAQEQKLLASDGSSSDYFGGSVSVSNDVAVVGASWDSVLGYHSGSAYVFRYDSVSGAWVEEQKLVASDGTGHDWFGTSVSMSNDVAVVGAHGHDDLGSASGSAYVFRYDSVSGMWAQEQKLLASDGAANDYFGNSVSMSNDVVVVGAYADDDLGSESGSAYIFDVGLQPVFVRGNCNGSDSAVDIADAIFLLSHLFPGPNPPTVLNCDDACDANDDGMLDIADAIALLSSLFGSPTIPLPSPNSDDGCGLDPTTDVLECAFVPPGC